MDIFSRVIAVCRMLKTEEIINYDYDIKLYEKKFC